jgi:hypothetical protein
MLKFCWRDVEKPRDIAEGAERSKLRSQGEIVCSKPRTHFEEKWGRKLSRFSNETQRQLCAARARYYGTPFLHTRSNAGEFAK